MLLRLFSAFYGWKDVISTNFVRKGSKFSFNLSKTSQIAIAFITPDLQVKNGLYLYCDMHLKPIHLSEDRNFTCWIWIELIWFIYLWEHSYRDHALLIVLVHNIIITMNDSIVLEQVNSIPQHPIQIKKSSLLSYFWFLMHKLFA